MTKESVDELLDRVANGNGYGDPEARLNDDRKIQALLIREIREAISLVRTELASGSDSATKVSKQLNRLTLCLVVFAFFSAIGNLGLLLVAVLK